MGTIDRGIRVFAAIILLGIAFGSAFAASDVLHWLMIAIALVFLLTAAVGNCPVYSILRIKTCRTS
ncbi:YgaP family membrane protein [Roseibium sp. ROS1]